MNVMEIVNSMGSDAVLLTHNDEWLERQRDKTAKHMDELANSLRALMLAQKVKRSLQQRNLVAVQHLLTENGEVKDIIIRLLPLPEAIQMLQPSEDKLKEMNRILQLDIWKQDGYEMLEDDTNDC